MLSKIFNLENQQLCINIMFLIFMISVCFYMMKQNKQIEQMTNTDDKSIQDAVKKVYDIDVAAIRNLSNIAGQINTDEKITFPGNVEITGTLAVKGTANVNGNITTDKDVIAKGTGQFGNAIMGTHPSWNKEYAGFGHKDKWNNDNNYGLIHKIDGTSYMGKKAYMGKDLTVEGKLTVKGGSDFSGGNTKMVVNDKFELYHTKNNKPELGWQYVNGAIYQKTGDLFLQNGKNATVDGKLTVKGDIYSKNKKVLKMDDQIGIQRKSSNVYLDYSGTDLPYNRGMNYVHNDVRGRDHLYKIRDFSKTTGKPPSNWNSDNWS